MSRLILLAALLFIGWWLWQRFQRPPASPPAQREADPIPMVRCHLCGVHLPRNEAIQRHQHWYCCPEHAGKDDGHTTAD